MSDIIEEQEIPYEQIDLDESEDETYIDELDRYQTDEDIEADAKEAVRILAKHKDEDILEED